MEKTLGFLTPAFLAITIFVFNALLPGKWITGYISKPNSTEKMRYRLNGFLVFVVIILLWFFAGYFNIVPFDWLYKYRWQGLAGAFVIGVIFSLVVVLPFPSVRKWFLADIYLGRIDNIQLWRGKIDAKMWLYLFGAIMLELNVLSFTAFHIMAFGDQASAGIILTAVLLSYFVVDYLTFEKVHLYTYDLFAERVGFKLGWGCIVFYSYFYSIALWSTVDMPDPQTPTWLLAIYVIVFFTGWTFARGANMQKYFFKNNPEKTFLWITPKAISDGNKTLLVNGFWGMSRHVNYLGEILMSTGIILCTGHPELIWPWLYPLYYVALLFTRQYYDDKRCALKYGKLWNEYVEKVPYRIIPFIY
jgi:protein-S-isoprenylcysteine O-methyltransferase Ste14